MVLFILSSFDFLHFYGGRLVGRSGPKVAHQILHLSLSDDLFLLFSFSTRLLHLYRPISRKIYFFPVYTNSACETCSSLSTGQWQRCPHLILEFPFLFLFLIWKIKNKQMSLSILFAYCSMLILHDQVEWLLGAMRSRLDVVVVVVVFIVSNVHLSTYRVGALRCWRSDQPNTNRTRNQKHCPPVFIRTASPLLEIMQ